MLKLLQGFVHAFRGISIVIRSERNFQIHLIAFLVVISTGVYFQISRFEWTILIFVSSLVMGLELVNTAVEKLCNEITEEQKSSIRNIKDISAGAVLVAAIGAFIIAAIIFSGHI